MELTYKEKQYLWTPEMDYDTFIRVNGLDKYYPPNFKAFEFFERQYIFNEFGEDK
jgi:hypothetical protein